MSCFIKKKGRYFIVVTRDYRINNNDGTSLLGIISRFNNVIKLDGLKRDNERATDVSQNCSFCARRANRAAGVYWEMLLLLSNLRFHFIILG